MDTPTITAEPIIVAPAVWKGVVAIERPDPTKARHGVPLMCRVVSARLADLGGKRAIVVQMPYAVLKSKFRSEDGDCCYCYAELRGDDLRVLERASQREFFLSPAH